MSKIKLTPEVKAALFMQGQAVAMAMEDEGLPDDVRERMARRINGAMDGIIDHDYQHVSTVHLS
jgi:hypothetical protein